MERVEAYRKNHNLSTTEFCKFAGISTSTYWKATNDATKLLPRTIKKIESVITTSERNQRNLNPNKRAELEVKKKVGQKIKELRSEYGYTQAQLSFEIEVTQDIISRFERGLLNNKYEEILDIMMEFFDVDYDYFEIEDSSEKLNENQEEKIQVPEATGVDIVNQLKDALEAVLSVTNQPAEQAKEVVEAVEPLAVGLRNQLIDKVPENNKYFKSLFESCQFEISFKADKEILTSMRDYTLQSALISLVESVIGESVDVYMKSKNGSVTLPIKR